MTQIKDVHTEHCCILHGCKYGNEDCTVSTKKKKQSYPCEICEGDGIDPTKEDPETSIYNFRPNSYYKFNSIKEEEKKEELDSGPPLLYVIGFVQDDMGINYLACSLYMFRTNPSHIDKFLSYSSHLECVKAIKESQWIKITKEKFESIRDKYTEKHPIKKLDFLKG